ncbi:MAG: hypothetical protein RBG13Loki_2607 [Promethearchaeota archaeon CR_4]|nr:MAG: hypothetical protein RBG13Loki_2607 [Candidatus Lokiarchaeota archaeon CR_4]
MSNVKKLMILSFLCFILFPLLPNGTMYTVKSTEAASSMPTPLAGGYLNEIWASLYVADFGTEPFALSGVTDQNL